jgi:hypothetical protein
MIVLTYSEAWQAVSSAQPLSVAQHALWSSSNFRHIFAARANCREGPIVLQNSKFAAVQIFGENLKREEIDDSYGLRRVTEVAYEFGRWR